MAHQTAAEGHRQANATSYMCWVWVVELKASETSPFPQGFCVRLADWVRGCDSGASQVVAKVGLARATFINSFRYGQLEESRITMRRVETTTSAATLMMRVRQVLM